MLLKNLKSFFRSIFRFSVILVLFILFENYEKNNTYAEQKDRQTAHRHTRGKLVNFFTQKTNTGRSMRDTHTTTLVQPHEKSLYPPEVFSRR